MDKIIVKLSEEQLSREELSDFEKEFDKELPDVYKEFLLKINGGLVKNREGISLILSIKYGNYTVEELIKTHQISENNLPNKYLPIALDLSDNPICLYQGEGANKNKVILYFLDMDAEPDILANSLEELLGVESIADL